MMDDKQVGVGSVTAWGLWGLSLALWMASVVYDTRPPATLAIIIAIAASTATTRCYLMSHERRTNAAPTPTPPPVHSVK